MSQTLTIAADSTLGWNVALSGPNGLPAVFDVASVIEADVYQGPNSPVVFHPAAAWADGSGSIIALRVDAAQTADLPPRNYNLQVTVIPAGTAERVVVFDGYLSVTPSPDVSPATATVLSPTAVTQGNAPARLGAVYCTDEDVAEEVPFDYVAICPKDQVKAQSWDGAFLPNSPWVLTSAAVNFARAGVGPNDVVYLTKPTQVFGASGVGTLMAVDSVVGNAVVLRRVYGQLGEGSPPVATAVTGVEFKVLTFLPQIERVCYRLRKRFAIDDNIPDERNSLLYDPLELREAAVLMVVMHAYASKGDKADYAHKMTIKQAELDAALGQLQVHWGALGLGKAPTSGVFGRQRR